MGRRLVNGIWDALNIARDNKALLLANSGFITNANPLACDLLGQSCDWLSGQKTAQLFEELPAEPPKAIAERWETTLRAADRPIPVEVTRQTLSTRHPEIEVYAIRDLRDRREAAEERERQTRALQQSEAELRAQNARLDAALENMLQGLAMFDADQRLIVCN